MGCALHTRLSAIAQIKQEGGVQVVGSMYREVASVEVLIVLG